MENNLNKLVKLSPLNHTWLLDLDGTLVVHNGYKLYGEDVLLMGAEKFLKNIPKEDKIIFLTSRQEEFKKQTEDFLIKHNIRFDQIIYNLPLGERVLINDKKPSGLKMAVAVNTNRDEFLDVNFEIDNNL